MVESETVGRLESLARLYRQGYRSQTVDQAVQKLVALEAERSQSDLYRLEERLAAFEKRYGMTSTEFYGRFRAGELGDEADMVEWSAFWEMRQATQKRLAELAGRR
jgi:hypothetical protein